MVFGFGQLWKGCGFVPTDPDFCSVLQCFCVRLFTEIFYLDLSFAFELHINKTLSGNLHRLKNLSCGFDREPGADNEKSTFYGDCKPEC